MVLQKIKFNLYFCNKNILKGGDKKVKKLNKIKNIKSKISIIAYMLIAISPISVNANSKLIPDTWVNLSDSVFYLA